MIGFRIHALALGILLSITGFAEAGSIAEDVLEGCQEDQAKYCSQVTLGEAVCWLVFTLTKTSCHRPVNTDFMRRPPVWTGSSLRSLM